MIQRSFQCCACIFPVVSNCVAVKYWKSHYRKLRVTWVYQTPSGQTLSSQYSCFHFVLDLFSCQLSDALENTFIIFFQPFQLFSVKHTEYLVHNAAGNCRLTYFNIFFLLRFILFAFERDINVREKYWSVASCTLPNWGLNLKPRHVTWPGM